MQARFRAWPLLVAALASGTGCPRDEAPPAEAADRPAPPAIEVRADRQDLVFSYRTDPRGDFATATSVDEIPEAARSAVVVTDLSLPPDVRRAGEYVYIADLRAPRDDGTYPVAVASRYGFEAGAGTSSAAPGAATGEVVMYSASWCGVCKKAKRLLDSWGVPFVEKDIEASRSAREELAAKARAHGFRPGGVPVIDVGGQILQGLDERTLRGALEAKGLL